MGHTLTVKGTSIGQGSPLVLVAGPCVIESYETTFEIAAFLKSLTRELNIPFIFKASYDKANRTSLDAFRGPGLADGLSILQRIKSELDITVLSDIHRINEIEAAAKVLDIIQVPAFLCRQTDIILAVSKTIINILGKVTSTGNQKILITERGTMFGYNNLVADLRSIKIMQTTGWPVIFDATHSIQLPGGEGGRSGGQREFAPVLARAAVAAGADGIFMEVHKDPDKALCDGPNSLKLDDLYELISCLKAIREVL
jgi:2-dehydro-3-deoxyphosphooctonate aldolase (KDO 8-P synthase)